LIGCFCTIMQKSLVVSLSSVHSSLNDALALAPRGWFQRFWHVELPLVYKGVLVGLLAVFVLAFRELNATVLTLPPGIETLSLRTFTLSHYGADDMVMALCLICIMVSVFCYGTLLVAFRRLIKRV